MEGLCHTDGTCHYCTLVLTFPLPRLALHTPRQGMNSWGLSLSMHSESSVLTWRPSWSVISLSHFWALLGMWGYFGWSPRLLWDWGTWLVLSAPKTSPPCFPSGCCKLPGWRGMTGCSYCLSFCRDLLVWIPNLSGQDMNIILSHHAPTVRAQGSLQRHTQHKLSAFLFLPSKSWGLYLVEGDNCLYLLHSPPWVFRTETFFVLCFCVSGFWYSEKLRVF